MAHSRRYATIVGGLEAPALVSAWSAWAIEPVTAPVTHGGRSSKNVQGANGKRGAQSRLEQLGLDVPLGGRRADEWVDGDPSHEGAEMLKRLRSGFADRVRSGTSDRHDGAMEWLNDFVHDTTRKPFVDPSSSGGKLYNQETFDLISEYARERGSRQAGVRRGKPLLADTIANIVSGVKCAVESAQHTEIVVKADNTARPRATRDMRREDGPRGERRLSRGLRTHHLRSVAELGFDRWSELGAVKWGVVLAAHQLLLRGGEVGRSSKRPFDAARGITWASFDWSVQPCEESRWLPWLMIWIVASKDPEWRHRAVGLPITRRSKWHASSTLGEDPLDAYDAILIAWRAREHSVDVGQRTFGQPSETPFFTDAKGNAWTTRDSQQLARDIAGALGMQPDDFGGKAFRIGGATELRDKQGDASQHTIKQRGRWGSDVAQVYQRTLLSEHLHASFAMGSGGVSRDMEEFSAGWSQPATVVSSQGGRSRA